MKIRKYNFQSQPLNKKILKRIKNLELKKKKNCEENGVIAWYTESSCVHYYEAPDKKMGLKLGCFDFCILGLLGLTHYATFFGID